MTEKLFAAIDLGGTKIYTVIADSEMKILSRIQLLTPAREDTRTLLSSLAGSVHAALERAGAGRHSLAACGICVAGF
ncbi:MAG: ROK family protein, partial [Firmicutes bacterium]|nr:ROK family protein [Bacillota bacterium]